MTTKLNEIADLISELELNDREAETILNVMKSYKRNYGRTYDGLRRIPGFRKLWDAIEEAASFSCRRHITTKGE